MGRLFLVLMLVFGIAGNTDAASKFFAATSLTGGAAGALDAIDGDAISDGDGAQVITPTNGYFYSLNASSGAAESSPDIVSPDDNAGNKRWILVNVVSGGSFDATAEDALTWSDGANASNLWTFDVTGTNPTILFGDAGATFTGTWTTDALIVESNTVDLGDVTEDYVLTFNASTNTWSGEAAEGGAAFDATTVDAVTWSDGANASNVWTFDLSGTDPTITWTSAGATFAGTWTATAFSGPLTGNVTGDVSGSSGSCTGLAATTTALATSRTIGGVGFDGTANINLPGVNAAGNQDTSGNATTSTTAATANAGDSATAFFSSGTIEDARLPATISSDVTGNAATVTTNANLSGDVTSVGNTATIADTVTVTGWTLGSSVATTPAANDNDTSLATTAFCETTQNYLKSSELAGSETDPNVDSAAEILAIMDDTALDFGTGVLTATGFVGPLTGNVTGNASGSSGSTTGNAATATALATARNIGGVSFDGTANINLPGVNATGNQDTSGNATTATTATTANAGDSATAFFSSGTIEDARLPATISSDITGNAATVTTITGLAPDTATTQAAQPNITSTVLLPWTGLKPGTDGNIPTFDASGNPAFVATGTAAQVLTSNGAGAAPTFQDAAATGAPTTAHYLTDQAEAGLSAEVVVTANGKSLVTAADYAAMRTLLDLEAGTDFNAYSATLNSLSGLTETNGGIAYGTADNAYAWLAAGASNYLLQGNGAGAPSWTNAPTVSAANMSSFPTLNQNTTGNAATATLASTVTITDNESTNENNPLVFVPDGDLDGGNLALESDGTAYYNPSTGVITATGFAGALTGNVTGNVSGSSGSVTGNAATATALATTRAIGGVNFDGTAAITPTTIVVADTTDTTAFVGLWESATGSLLPKTDAGITYNAGTGVMTLTENLYAKGLTYGIDTLPAGHGIWGFQTETANTGTLYSTVIQSRAEPTANSSAVILPLVGLAEHNSSYDNTTGHMVGALGWAKALDSGGTATVASAIGVEGKIDVEADQTITLAIGVESQIGENAGVITEFIAYHVKDHSGLSEAPTTTYSFKSDDSGAILENDGPGTFTGTLSGEVGITIDTAATVDLSTAANARGQMRVNGDDDAIDYTLPPAEAGLNICFYSAEAQVITIDPDDGTDTIFLDGGSVGAGDAIDSPGEVGNFICLLALDSTNWVTLGRSGAWVDGGAD